MRQLKKNKLSHKNINIEVDIYGAVTALACFFIWTKICVFIVLKWGKPVLASNLPSLWKLIDRYQFGSVIKEPSDAEEIEAAIARILSDYSTYSRNAKACFEAEFDFSKKMQPILDFINSL